MAANFCAVAIRVSKVVVAAGAAQNISQVGNSAVFVGPQIKSSAAQNLCRDSWFVARLQLGIPGRPRGIRRYRAIIGLWAACRLNLSLEAAMGYRQTEFPAKVIDFPIAQLDFSEQELIETFGAGVVPDPEPFTFPGPVKLWALVTDDGQHLVLEHHLGQEKITVLYAAPMDLTLALASLNIEKDRVVWEQTQEKINKFSTLHNVQF